MVVNVEVVLKVKNQLDLIKSIFAGVKK